MAITAQQKEKIKLVEKEKKKKTAEELIKKSEKALGNSKLIEIVSNASTVNSKINLTGVYEKAFELVLNQTGDLKKAKEYAVATRWLAMLKRDYPSDFDSAVLPMFKPAVYEKDIKSELALKPESKPKSKKVEIELFGDIIFSGDYGMSHKSMASLRILRTDLIFNGIKMAADLLESITDIEPLSPKDANFPRVKWGFAYNYHSTDNELSEEKRLSALRDYLIQILEEKFGLKIRMCGNCENYKMFPDNPFCGHCSLVTIHSVYYNWSCSNITGLGQQWIPKKIPSEKKEEEKTCENCGQSRSECLMNRPCLNWVLKN